MKKITAIFSSFFIASIAVAQTKTVVLDSYFNNEFKKNTKEELVSFHYKWDETAQTGFSIFGEKFKNNGGQLGTLNQAPSTSNLATANVYIIVDPDTEKETQNPAFMASAYADIIANWVNNGGVLLLMANDKANTELKYFNILAQKFGFYFNDDLISHVTDDKHFEDGAIEIKKNKVFKTAKKIFLKDACSISIQKKSEAILLQDDKPIIAGKKFGKGYVLAIGDPWLYNEYVNGRLPADFENDKAAEDLAKYLLKKVKL